jgi:DNA-binding response OmpR family regulator
MPLMSGFDLIKKIKSHITGKDTSIFILSSDETQESKMMGLHNGISDYLFKLMPIDEIMLRIFNGINSVKVVSPIKRIGNLRLTTNSFQVEIDKKEVFLTLKEYKILISLSMAQDFISNLEELKSFVYHQDFISDSSFRVHLTNLRGKLKDWDYEIITKNKNFINLIAK